MFGSFMSRVGSRLSGKKTKQSGFTLVELLVTVAIIVILILLAAPFFKQLIDASKTPSAASDLQKIITKVVANHAGGNIDYAASTDAEIASAASGLSTIFTAIGTGNTATLGHSFGAAGSLVTFAPTTVTNTNDAGLVTVPTASKGTCPEFVTALQKTATAMSINGTVVKAVGGSYDPATAASACTSGDTNSYTFTIR